MTLSDVANQITNNENEIREYISSSLAEKEKLVMRLDELDDGIRSAEKDLRRCERAKSAITGDDEPQKDLRGIHDSVVRAKPRSYPSSDGRG